MWLCEEEQIIVKYLQHNIATGASPREICRKASTKDRWKENERWAYPFLSRLREKGLAETDAAGNYRLVKKEEENAPPKS